MLTHSVPSDKTSPELAVAPKDAKPMRIRPAARPIDLYVTISNTPGREMVTRGNTLSLPPSNLRPTEITVVALLLALLVLLPPLSRLWLSPASAWFVPYIVWGAIILLAFLLQRLLSKHAI